MKRTFSLFMLVALLGLASFAAAADQWAVDKPHSSVSFTASHLIVTKVSGYFDDFDGTVGLDPANLATMSADFTVQVASIQTQTAKRDNHLKSDDFFNAEMYPTIHFKSKKAEVVGKGKTKLTGDLTIRDVTKEVTFDVEGFDTPVSAWGTTKIGGSAKATINRFDFGVKWDSKMDNGGWVVGENVDIVVNAELNKVEPGEAKQ